MKPNSTRTSLVRLLGYFLLIILGFGMALVVTELFLRTFPNLVPAEVRVNPPVRRVKAFIDETYDLKQSDGDLFQLMKGAIAPLTSEQDQVVATVHMTTDADGFRNLLPEKGSYDIVALGDSFTRGSGVATPWPQKVAEITGNDVLNLADVGFGPQDELSVLRHYGLKKHPQCVVMAYFEGNDLYDAAAYAHANPFILTRFMKYEIGRGRERLKANKFEGVQAAATRTYRYPITISINDNDLKMAFFSSYISWLSISREAIEASQNYHIVTDTILKAQELSETTGARFLLVYIPTKSHIYLPLLNDAEMLERIFADVPTLELDNTGFFQFRNKLATPELVRQHIDDQEHLFSDFATENNIAFLDLTYTFQKEASRGAELYYSSDTHWNQSGQDLAAQTISRYLTDNLPAFDLTQK